MMKRIFTLCFVLLCTIHILAYDCLIDGIYYNLDSIDNTAEVTCQEIVNNHYQSEYSGVIVIPSSITYNSQTYSVTTIGNGAFCSCTELTTVTIPNSVTTIGRSAFVNCSNLTSITIPSSVTKIGSSTFSFCSGLKKTNFTGTIADWCKIEFLSVDANPIYYSHNFYINDVEVKNLVIPNGIDTIGNYTFSGCSGLTSVTIPNSVTTIGNWAFSGCSGLTKTNYTGTIADWCKIKFDYISSNPIYYSHNFYINDVEVKNLVIPEGVDTIGDYAFAGCRSLTSVTIPSSVTTIGEKAFYVCENLKTTYNDSELLIAAGNINYGYISYYATRVYSGIPTGDFVIKSDIILNGYIGKSFVVNIPNSITTIGDYAFSGCRSLTSVTIPSSVTMIGKSAFYGCSGLTSMTCDAITPPICGSNCFYNVSKSIPVYVPARAVDAYKKALYWKDFANIQANPNDFAVITCIAENGTYIGADTYIKGDTCVLEVIPDWGYHFTQWNDGNTDNPRSCVVTQDSTFTAQIDIAQSGQCGDNLYWTIANNTLVISGSGGMYDYTNSSLPEWYLSNKKITKLIINDGITHIGDSAFAGCENIQKDLILPNSLQTIGDYAFQNCKNITSISFGTDLKSIGDYAFAGCIRIDNMTCPTTRTPDVTIHTFDMVSRYAYLYVLQSYERTFKIDPYWGVFDIKTIVEETDLADLQVQSCKIVKFIHNGRLLIEHNGIRYDAHGARVK